MKGNVSLAEHDSLHNFEETEQIYCSFGITRRMSLNVYSLHKTELKIQ